MPVSLAEAQKNVQDDVQRGVIDEFRKSSYLLENLTFDDAVSPGTNGATLTYGYTRLITQPTAAFRAINSEYAPQEVTKQRYTVELKVFGGAYEIDRVIVDMGDALVNENTLQMQQKVKAARALFHDTVINGDSGVDANAFDGLDKAITGTSTEFNATDYIDLSTSANLDQNYKEFMDLLDEFLSLLDGTPTALMGNSKLITKIKAIARRAGYMTQSEDAFGRKISAYDGIPLIDLGAKAGSNDPVVAIEERNIDAAPVSGLTDLYAVRLGLDGFHAVSMKGVAPIKTWLPDFTTAGAVKKGEVEMVAAVALKATKAAAVFRNIKVQ